MINISFLSKTDYRRNPVRANGLGKAGLVGIAAAITNVNYNAIGERKRDLTFTTNKILMA